MPTRRTALKVLTAAGAVAAGGAAMLTPRASNAYYAGPVSDHFDGVRFFNPGQASSGKGFQHFLAMRFTEDWSTWPERIDSPFADTPPRAVDGGRTRVSFVGHASWLIQTAGLNILVDPVWSERASPVAFAGPKRVNDPGIAFDALPRIDVVLLTHNHYDHMDAGTLARLRDRDKPKVIAPLGNDAIVQAEVPGLGMTTLDWYDTAALSPSVRLHAVPTWHWSARGLRDRRHALWASFIIETPSGRIYAVGDSGFGSGTMFRDIGKRFGDIELALLPIGAYEPRWFMKQQHMDPAEAVDAFALCGAKTALGHHWGTFQLTAEDAQAPRRALAAALDRKGITPDRFLPVQPGQVHVLGS